MIGTDYAKDRKMHFAFYALFVTSKIEFSNSPILEFKVLQNAFKKKWGLEYFLKWCIRTNTQLKRGFIRLFGFYAALWIQELENYRIGEFDYWCHEQVIIANSSKPSVEQVGLNEIE